MSEQTPNRGAAEDTDTETEAGPPPARQGLSEAQEAHGGSMAPGAVDETGHRIANPPPTADRA